MSEPAANSIPNSNAFEQAFRREPPPVFSIWRGLYFVQRHAPLFLLIGAAIHADVNVAVLFCLYVLVNAACGRMAATAAGFLFVAIRPVGGDLFVHAAASGAGGWVASLAWQALEANYLIPWFKRRRWNALLEGPRSVFFWSVVLSMLTAVSLWLAAVLSRQL